MIEAFPTARGVAGDVALDLANTVSRRGTPCAVDHLGDADAVIRWAGAAGIVDEDFGVAPLKRQALLTAVHRLRGAIASVGSAIAEGQPPPAGALEAIRDFAARSLATASLDGVPARLAFIGHDRLLGPIAWAAVDLLRGDRIDRLKICRAEDCRRLFLDTSRNGSRRWCDMATCGTRAPRRSRTDATDDTSDPPATKDEAAPARRPHVADPVRGRWSPGWNRAGRTSR